jgi:predicted nucleotidyltransferase
LTRRSRSNERGLAAALFLCPGLPYIPAMTLDDVRRLIEPEKDALRAKGVSALYVFGSVARGEAGPVSDVDFFIDLEPDARFSIIDLVGVQGDLSERLGVAADLHTRRGLHYWIKDQILAEAVQLF